MLSFCTEGAGTVGYVDPGSPSTPLTQRGLEDGPK